MEKFKNRRTSIQPGKRVTSERSKLWTNNGNLHTSLRWRMALTTAMMACLLLSSCVKDPNDVSREDDGKIDVNFTVEGINYMKSAVLESKADEEEPVVTELSELTTLRVIAYRHTDTEDDPSTKNYVADGAYVVMGGELVPCEVDGQGKFKQTTNNRMELWTSFTYDFYIVSPALPLSIDKVSLAGNVTNDMDYATAVATACTIKAGETLRLPPLQRQMASLAFRFSFQRNGEPSIDANIKSFTINTITVKGIWDHASNVGINQALQPEGNTSVTWTNADISRDSYAIPKTLIPLSERTIQISVDYTVNGDRRTSETEVKIDANAGCALHGALYLDADRNIMMECPWTENSDNNPFLHANDWSYPYVMGDRTIILNDVNGGFSWRRHSGWSNTPNEGIPFDKIFSNLHDFNSVGQKAFEVAYGESAECTFDDRDWACNSYSESVHPSGWRVPTPIEAAIICRLLNGLNVHWKGNNWTSWTSGGAYGPDTWHNWGAIVMTKYAGTSYVPLNVAIKLFSTWGAYQREGYTTDIWGKQYTIKADKQNYWADYYDNMDFNSGSEPGLGVDPYIIKNDTYKPDDRKRTHKIVCVKDVSPAQWW